EEVRAESLGHRVITDHLDPADAGVTDTAISGVDHEEAAGDPLVDVTRVDLDGGSAVCGGRLAPGDPPAAQGGEEIVFGQALVFGHVREARSIPGSAGAHGRSPLTSRCAASWASAATPLAIARACLAVDQTRRRRDGPQRARVTGLARDKAGHPADDRQFCSRQRLVEWSAGRIIG